MTVSHSADNPFVIPNQTFYTRNDNTSSEKMSITPKMSKMNTQFDLVDVFNTTLSVSKRPVSQRDAVLIEGQ